MSRPSWREALFTPTGAFKPWTSTLVVVVSMGLVATLTIADGIHRERKICGVIVLIDDRNQKLPPVDESTPEGKDTMDFRRTLHHYRESLGC